MSNKKETLDPGRFRSVTLDELKLRAEIIDRRILYATTVVVAFVLLYIGYLNLETSFSAICFSISSAMLGAIASTTVKIFERRS